MFYYQLSAASFLIPKAILGILVPYILTVILLETAENIGIALSIFMLPSLFFMLFAGALADKFNKKTMLIILQIANIIPILALYLIIKFQTLNFFNFVIFMFISGTFMAFVQPTLDATLNQITQLKLKSAISLSVSLMYVMTLAGFLVASFTDIINVENILLLMIVILLIGIYFTTKIKYEQTAPTNAKRPIVNDIILGFKHLKQSKHMLATVVLMALAGPILGGPYAVLVPIILRDFYQATAFDFSITFATFMLGGALSSAFLLRFDTGLKQGQLLILGYITGGVAMLIWYFEPPYWLFLTSQIVWGMGGAMCICSSRSIIQTFADKHFRARILSIMYLGDEGGSPIGSLLIGYTIALLGIHAAAIIPAILTFFVAICVIIFSNIWQQDC